jgi:hypothetical protein
MQALPTLSQLVEDADGREGRSNRESGEVQPLCFQHPPASLPTPPLRQSRKPSRYSSSQLVEDADEREGRSNSERTERSNLSAFSTRRLPYHRPQSGDHASLPDTLLHSWLKTLMGEGRSNSERTERSNLSAFSTRRLPYHRPQSVDHASPPKLFCTAGWRR